MHSLAVRVRMGKPSYVRSNDVGNLEELANDLLTVNRFSETIKYKLLNRYTRFGDIS